MMDEHLKQIHEYCSEPRRARDVAEHFNVPMATIQWRIGRLRKMKALDMHRTKKKGSKVYDCWYTKKEIEIKIDPKPYEPLGVCIWGVWF